MREKLISYIDYLFENAPDNALELKNEIKANTLDRYDDLIARGKSEEAAFNAAVAGIGDVGALLNEITGEKNERSADNNVVKRALLLSAAVALYILSLIPAILLDHVNEDLGVCLMFVMWALATALIIYRATAYKKYEMKSKSQAEQIKKRKIEQDGMTALRRSISGVLWALGVLIYFALSFITRAWYITWIVFLICAALENVIRLAFTLKK